MDIFPFIRKLLFTNVVILLQFKYKRRVYKSLQYDAKTLQKVHTKVHV
jgi:hypothetical protein